MRTASVYNEHFAVEPPRPEDLHRSLNVAASRLNEVLCNREQRHVSQQLGNSYQRKQIILKRSEWPMVLVGSTSIFTTFGTVA